MVRVIQIKRGPKPRPYEIATYGSMVQTPSELAQNQSTEGLDKTAADVEKQNAANKTVAELSAKLAGGSQLEETARELETEQVEAAQLVVYKPEDVVVEIEPIPKSVFDMNSFLRANALKETTNPSDGNSSNQTSVNLLEGSNPDSTELQPAAARLRSNSISDVQTANARNLESMQGSDFSAFEDETEHNVTEQDPPNPENLFDMNSFFLANALREATNPSDGNSLNQTSVNLLGESNPDSTVQQHVAARVCSGSISDVQTANAAILGSVTLEQEPVRDVIEQETDPTKIFGASGSHPRNATVKGLMEVQLQNGGNEETIPQKNEDPETTNEAASMAEEKCVLENETVPAPELKKVPELMKLTVACKPERMQEKDASESHPGNATVEELMEVQLKNDQNEEIIPQKLEDPESTNEAASNAEEMCVPETETVPAPELEKATKLEKPLVACKPERMQENDASESHSGNVTVEDLMEVQLQNGGNEETIPQKIEDPESANEAASNAEEICVPETETVPAPELNKAPELMKLTVVCKPERMQEKDASESHPENVTVEDLMEVQLQNGGKEETIPQKIEDPESTNEAASNAEEMCVPETETVPAPELEKATKLEKPLVACKPERMQENDASESHSGNVTVEDLMEVQLQNGGNEETIPQKIEDPESANEAASNAEEICVPETETVPAPELNKAPELMKLTVVCKPERMQEKDASESHPENVTVEDLMEVQLQNGGKEETIPQKIEDPESTNEAASKAEEMCVPETETVPAPELEKNPKIIKLTVACKPERMQEKTASESHPGNVTVEDLMEVQLQNGGNEGTISQKIEDPESTNEAASKAEEMCVPETETVPAPELEKNPKIIKLTVACKPERMQEKTASESHPGNVTVEDLMEVQLQNGGNEGTISQKIEDPESTNEAASNAEEMCVPETETVPAPELEKNPKIIKLTVACKPERMQEKTASESHPGNVTVEDLMEVQLQNGGNEGTISQKIEDPESANEAASNAEEICVPETETVPAPELNRAPELMKLTVVCKPERMQEKDASESHPENVTVEDLMEVQLQNGGKEETIPQKIEDPESTNKAASNAEEMCVPETETVPAPELEKATKLEKPLVACKPERMQEKDASESHSGKATVESLMEFQLQNGGNEETTPQKIEDPETTNEAASMAEEKCVPENETVPAPELKRARKLKKPRVARKPKKEKETSGSHSGNAAVEGLMEVQLQNGQSKKAIPQTVPAPEVRKIPKEKKPRAPRKPRTKREEMAESGSATADGHQSEQNQPISQTIPVPEVMKTPKEKKPRAPRKPRTKREEMAESGSATADGHQSEQNQPISQTIPVPEVMKIPKEKKPRAPRKPRTKREEIAVSGSAAAEGHQTEESQPIAEHVESQKPKKRAAPKRKEGPAPKRRKTAGSEELGPKTVKITALELETECAPEFEQASEPTTSKLKRKPRSKSENLTAPKRKRGRKPKKAENARDQEAEQLEAAQLVTAAELEREFSPEFEQASEPTTSKLKRKPRSKTDNPTAPKRKRGRKTKKTENAQDQEAEQLEAAQLVICKPENIVAEIEPIQENLSDMNSLLRADALREATNPSNQVDSGLLEESIPASPQQPEAARDRSCSTSGVQIANAANLEEPAPSVLEQEGVPNVMEQKPVME